MRDDTGSALVEFVGATVVLLLPVLYLVLTLARVQAATFAVESGAREAARVVVSADDLDEGVARARQVVGLALHDQGFDDAVQAFEVACSSTPCRAPGSTVRVRVRYDVVLPFVPASIGDGASLAVPVEATEVMPVDDHVAAP
ncbi:TadE-like protein [Sediminihabitans luteus]|uniref:TadE-like protein n=1 Tax=Sediminihabitans luteus TaxID=1138585 RepID=A0A2M9CYB1_9CELL|nr:pilus assembly protein TadE [Sediminihabitans luteus]PJJ76926.1 TadE-like protein [Sediminihabitans luteus]GII99567.1 hypothetical protein Slu03_19450 [Sediminihabitans luteus]